MIKGVHLIWWIWQHTFCRARKSDRNIKSASLHRSNCRLNLIYRCLDFSNGQSFKGGWFNHHSFVPKQPQLNNTGRTTASASQLSQVGILLSLVVLLSLLVTVGESQWYAKFYPTDAVFFF